MADPEDELSLAELGRQLGVSRERARQLEARAKKKLKGRLEALSRDDVVEHAPGSTKAPPWRGERAAAAQPSVMGCPGNARRYSTDGAAAAQAIAPLPLEGSGEESPGSTGQDAG